MNNLVINVEKNNDYILKMIDLITRFVDEINHTKTYVDKLDWVSLNKDKIINKYQLELETYLTFAKNLYQIIDKLKEFNNEFYEYTKEVKEKIKYLEKELGIGEDDEQGKI